MYFLAPDAAAPAFAPAPVGAPVPFAPVGAPVAAPAPSPKVDDYETLIEPALRARRIVVLEPARWLDVPLYWQHAAVRSSTLQHITRALQAAAAVALVE